MRGTFSHLSGSLHGVLSVKLNVSSPLAYTTVYHLVKHLLWRVLVFQWLHPVVKHCRVVQPGQISLLVSLSRRVESFTLQLLLLWRCWWLWKYLTSSRSLWNLQLQERKLCCYCYFLEKNFLSQLCTWLSENGSCHDTLNYSHFAHLHCPTVKTLGFSPQLMFSLHFSCFTSSHHNSAPAPASQCLMMIRHKPVTHPCQHACTLRHKHSQRNTHGGNDLSLTQAAPLIVLQSLCSHSC